MRMKILIRPGALLLIAAAVLGCSGCQSFRWGEYSYQDLVQRQRELHQINSLMIKPGTMNYSWGK
jgi:hypothetical protein